MSQSENLLQQLEPVVRRLSAEAIDRAALTEGMTESSQSAKLPFQNLINQAVAGDLTTGRRITSVADITLSNADTERIAAATDRAAAAGGKRAIVFLGEEIYLLDIVGRRLTAAIRNGGSESGLQNAGSGEVRLDNPRWRIETNDELPTIESDQNHSEPGPSTEEITEARAIPRADRDGLSLLVVGAKGTPGERIISGIDTAILLDSDADVTNQTVNSSPRLLAHLRGPVTGALTNLLQISG